jgi:hypothetical protein
MDMALWDIHCDIKTGTRMDGEMALGRLMLHFCSVGYPFR